MKILLKLFFIILVLNSCKEINTSKHPSFFEIESFVQSEKRFKEFDISNINIDKFNISEFKQFKPESSKLESRKITAFYDLTLHSGDKKYKSKAEVFSIDSVNWEIAKISIVNQTDSIGKHYEEKITWEHPISLKPYNVTLKITDK